MDFPMNAWNFGIGGIPMAIDKLQEKIRKMKNPSMIDLSLPVTLYFYVPRYKRMQKMWRRSNPFLLPVVS